MQALSRLFQSISSLTQPNVQTSQRSPPLSQPVDCLVILGPHTERDHVYQKVGMLLEGLTSTFIGDGQRGITKEMIHDARRQGLIGPNTQIICIAHGSANDTDHDQGSTHSLLMQRYDNLTDSSAPINVSTKNFLGWLRNPLTSHDPNQLSVPGFEGNIHLVSCEVGEIRKEKISIDPILNDVDTDEKDADQIPEKGYTFLHGGNKLLSSTSSDEGLQSLYSYLRHCKRSPEEAKDPHRMLERIKEKTMDTVILLDKNLKEVKKYPAPKSFWDIFPNRRDEIMREYERNMIKNQPMVDGDARKESASEPSKILMDQLSIKEGYKLSAFFMVRLHHLKTKKKLDELGQQIASDPRMANIKRMTKTLLMVAAQYPVHYKNAEIGSGDIVDMLIRSGTKVNARDFFGRTAAHYAAENGNIAAIKVLYQQTPDSKPHHKKLGINDRDVMGRTVAHYAARAGSAGTLDLLLKEKAKVKAVDWSGFHTLLHSACESRRQRLKTVECVLKHGGQSLINKRNFFGKTALHIAIVTGDVATVKVLLNNGADPTQRTFGLSTPSDLARGLSGEASQKILDLLKNAKAKKNAPTSRGIFLVAHHSSKAIGPQDRAQTAADCLEVAGLQPALSLLVDCWPKWKIGWQQAPRGAGTHQPSQGIDQSAQIMMSLGRLYVHQCQVRISKTPFLIRHIGRVELASIRAAPTTKCP